MCDFFSAIVSASGEFYHAAHNSHSTMVTEAGWRENDQMNSARFVEAEWSGEGDYPGATKICRNTLNAKQIKVVDQYYVALAKLLQDPKQHAERMLFGKGIFAAKQFGDVRWKVLIAGKCSKKVTRRICETYLFVSKKLQPVHELPPWLKTVDGSLDLRSYQHALPAGLTHCGGYLDLSSYQHALPAGFTHCGGDLYLSSYQHALPAGFKKNHKA